MKNIKQYITEKLKIYKKKYTLFPKSKDELREMILKEIEDNGNNCDLNHIDVSKLTNLAYVFDDIDFNGDISQWDVSNVKIMNNMFSQNEYFNGDISDWNVSKVIDMYAMFANSKFNRDISNWDVHNVENMNAMFEFAEFNQDISKWDVSNVTDMSFMFRGSKFNQNISDWDVSNVRYMDGMFSKASSFNQNISNWKIKPNCRTIRVFTKCPIRNEYVPKKNGQSLLVI